MNTRKLFLFFSLTFLISLTSCDDSEIFPKLVEPEGIDKIPGAEAGKPSQLWIDFVDAHKAGKTDTQLLDFSYAGYHHGIEAIPNVNYKIFNVTDYGAVANDNLSDRQAFVDAIAAAETNGSGVIYFPAGRFDLHTGDDPDATIYIKGSNIVLRGAGSEEGGTEIFMDKPNPARNENQLWSSPVMIAFKKGYTGGKLTDVTDDASKGSFSVSVASASLLKVGEWVFLKLLNNDPELVAEELAPYAVDPSLTDIVGHGVNVQDIHQIRKIEGNTITFAEPIMHKVDKKWGWTITQLIYSEENGVEGINFVGNFQDKFVHHLDWLHDGGYKPLDMVTCVNSWIRNCRFTSVSEAVSIIKCANFSVLNCTIDGHGGHSAIRAQGSSRVFMGGLSDESAQFHSYGISKPSMGTVLWRINIGSGTSFESHASQPRATLIDASKGGFMLGRAGGAGENTPNHLRDLVLWNFNETDAAQTNLEVWHENSVYKGFLMPIFVGFHGTGTTFKKEQFAVIESLGSPVYPESLYEAQLKLRLGALPNWLLKLKSEIQATNP